MRVLEMIGALQDLQKIAGNVEVKTEQGEVIDGVELILATGDVRIKKSVTDPKY